MGGHLHWIAVCAVDDCGQAEGSPAERFVIGSVGPMTENEARRRLETINRECDSTQREYPYRLGIDPARLKTKQTS